MRVRMNKSWTTLVWVALLIFMMLTITFPKWITCFYPQPHKPLVYNFAQQNDIDPHLVFAIIRAESGFETTARSPAGAQGLMQIMPETAEWIAGQKGVAHFEAIDLHDPEVNIDFGCWYIANLKQEFAGQLPLVVAAYNAGRGRVKDWLLSGQWDGSEPNLDNIPFPETREYVKKVLGNYEAYQAIYK